MNEDDLRARLREAGDPDRRQLDASKAASRGLRLRRRRLAVRAAVFGVVVLAAVLGGVATGRRTAPPIAVVMGAPPPPPAQSTGSGPGTNGYDVNQQIIDSLPVVEGARFSAYSQVEGPSGKRSIISYITYRAASTPFDAEGVLRNFGAMDGWTVERDNVFPTRHSLALLRGNELIYVTAFPEGPQSPPTITIVVAGVDGKAVLAAL